MKKKTLAERGIEYKPEFTVNVERSPDGICRAYEALRGLIPGGDFERCKSLEDEILVAALEVIQDMGKKNSIQQARKLASYALATQALTYPRNFGQ